MSDFSQYNSKPWDGKSLYNSKPFEGSLYDSESFEGSLYNSSPYDGHSSSGSPPLGARERRLLHQYNVVIKHARAQGNREGEAAFREMRRKLLEE